ncbi:MAG: hypothetical protein WCQ99_05160 [Pseudomonadota bacterium]
MKIKLMPALWCMIFLCACSEKQELLPEPPAEPCPRTALPYPVIMEEESIYSPAPRDNGAAPEACDYIHYLRFRPATDDGSPRAVHAVVIMIPGYLGGAGSFSYLARQLVSLSSRPEAKAVEVWALDRRANCLEDQAGMQMAEAARDPQAARDYYYSGSSIQGQTFGGFYAAGDTPYLSEFGLKLLMQDIHTIIAEKIPDPAERKKSVFIAGHSLGATLAAVFASWDFDQDPATPDDAGFNNCAGLIGLEGQVAVWPSSTTEKKYEKRLSELRAAAPGKAAGFSITPEAMALIEILALYAAFAPDEESTLFRSVSVAADTEALITYFTTFGLEGAGSSAPALGDFHFSNEAMLGLFSDDNFQPISIGRVSLGFLAGGPVTKRGSFSALEKYFDTDGLFIPADSDNGTRYTWANFDTTGSADDPAFTDTSGAVTLTTAGTEVTDLQDYARAVFEGPLNFYEWYFPERLSLDLGIASASYRARCGIASYHLDKINSLPKIEFLAKNIPGYDHLDVLCAAADRPQRRKNEVLEPLLKFLMDYSTGTVRIP